MEYFIVIFRTLFFYFLVIFMYRIMGKREVGQLGVVDLIVSFLIAELVAISIDNTKESIWLAIIPIVLLVGCQLLVAYISIKEPKIRYIFDGKPSVIIKDGKVMFKEMLRQRYNLDDLLNQLRDKDYKSIDEIEYAILETSGKLSVFPKQKNEKEKYIKSDYPLPLILDGEVNYDTLEYLKKDDEWLLKNLNDEVYNIFYAFYQDKKIYVIKQDELLEK